MKQRENLMRITAVAALIVFALLSFFVLSDKASDAGSYSDTIAALDEKKATVMGFTATAATASTAIAMIPGDGSTPIANQIMEISEYLLIVVCFLVLEKSLLTVMGFFAFKILLPVACVLMVIHLLGGWLQPKVLALKLGVFALVIASIIPLSVQISDLIYEVNRNTVDQITEEIEMLDATEPNEAENEEEEEQSWLDSFKDAVSGAVDKVEEVFTNTTEDAKALLNKFVDAIALFLIAYCAIPVIVIFVMVGLVKYLFAIPVPMPKPPHRHSAEKHQKSERLEEPAQV